MRRSLAAALLCTTFWTSPAQAVPVAAFISGFQAALGATVGVSGALGIASAVGGFSGFAFGAGAIAAGITGSFLGRALLGLGLSALAASSFDTALPPPSEQLVNFAQPITYRTWVFGESRGGGPIAFTAAANDRRHYTIILAGHEIDGVSQHWLDEYIVGVDADQADYSGRNILTNQDSAAFTAPNIMRNLGRIEVGTGQAGQASPEGLIDTFDELTPEYDFAGLAVGHLWARKVAPQDFSNAYPQGRQWAYTPVTRGNNRIYDPRDGQLKYTANAALIIAYWLTQIWGFSVDWDAVAIEADACDVQIVDNMGISRPKWTINGRIDDSQTFEAQRSAMGLACDAMFFERADGKVGFYVGRYQEPDVTLTEQDFLSCDWTLGQWGTANEFQINYVEPDNAWRETPSGVWVDENSNNSDRDGRNAFLVTNHSQAFGITKRLAKQSRPQAQLRGTIGLVGYELIGKRFFRFNHSGINGSHVMEIGRLERVSAWEFEVEAISVLPEDFDRPASEEPDRPVFQRIDSAFVSQDVTGVTATPGENNSIVVEWDEQPDYLWQTVRWKPVAAVDWQSTTITDAATSFIITGLIDGTDYNVEVRNASAGLLSNPSDWIASTPAVVMTVGNSTAPAGLDAFAVSSVLQDATVDFTAPNDANYFATRIWRGTTATFPGGDATHTEYGIASNADSWTDEGLAPGTYYYWGTPINASGVESATRSGPESVTIS